MKIVVLNEAELRTETISKTFWNQDGFWANHPIADSFTSSSQCRYRHTFRIYNSNTLDDHKQASFSIPQTLSIKCEIITRDW